MHNAWLRTLEDGIHTYDIYNEGVSASRRSARKEFAQAVVERVGKKPEKLKPVSYARRRKQNGEHVARTATRIAQKKDMRRRRRVSSTGPRERRRISARRLEAAGRRRLQADDGRQPRREGVSRAASRRRLLGDSGAAASMRVSGA